MASAFRLTLTCLLAVSLLAASGCREKFNIRDVDPGQAGEVRSLTPESQEAIRLADLMSRSLLACDAISQAGTPPTIAMLPMQNDTRFAFSKDIFSTRLRAELNKTANGAVRFIARDAMADIESERAAKRAGAVDYDPARRTETVAGADFFLRGKISGLSSASQKGQAEYTLYTFELIDPETALILWEDLFELKKEGRDDVIYK